MADGLLSGLSPMLDTDAYLQHINFAQRALGTHSEDVQGMLATYTQNLSDSSFAGFKMTLAMLIGNEADAARKTGLQQLLQWSDKLRRADVVARPRPVVAAPGLDGLLDTFRQATKKIIEHFHEHKASGADASSSFSEDSEFGRDERQELDAGGVHRPNVAQICEAAREFKRTGQYPGGAAQLQADFAALQESGEAEQLQEALQEGVDGAGSKSLNPYDYYRSGDGLYELRWPIGFQLPMPFDQLDRETQFVVLFGEWRRRHIDASYALLRGDTAQAQELYEECLARAQQIDVSELVALSHEGLADVAAHTNQRSLERKHLKLAVAAREVE